MRGFIFIPRAAAAPALTVRIPYCAAPAGGTSFSIALPLIKIGLNHQQIMEHSTPLDITQPNVQDQEEYSIPDDDLRTGTSSTYASDDGTVDTDMDAADDLTTNTATHSIDGGVPHDEECKETSKLSTWSRTITRKRQSADKKLLAAPNNVDQLHHQRMRDPAYYKLRETGLDEVTTTFPQAVYGNDEPRANAKNTIDGGPAHGGTNHDTPGAKSPLTQGGSRIPYAHELRRGGLTEAEKQTVFNRNSSHHKNAVSNSVLPSASFAPESTSTTFYTYRAQLTFGLPKNSEDINVAKYFRRWIFSSCASIDHFALVPYEDEKGLQISSLEQVPEDNMDFYSTYYHNHRVLNTGNLTGMVSFQCSVPWARLKSPNSPFFNWLRINKVFLNQTKFKTSSLVPCGFLLGAHPGHLRRDEAESELRVSLGFKIGEELPFQLSSRSVSVPLQEGKPDRFVFQAVIVETSTQQAASLRERFYSLGNPVQAQEKFPYTGKYQFVPFLKTKEWTVPKILSLARLHVKIIQDLRSIFLVNLKDIHNSIAHDGTTLMQGFYGMQYNLPVGDGEEPMSEPLLHSIHNTGKPTTKVALVSTSHYDSALTQLSAIHSILTSYIPKEYLDRVFIDSLQAGIRGQQIDSVSSCNSAAYATELLSKYNPQDCDDLAEVTPAKRFRPVPLTYAAAAGVDTPTEVLPTSSTVAVSSVTSGDLDQLFEKMKAYVAGSTTTSGVNIEDLEARFSQSTKEVQEMRDQLSNSVSNITARVDTLADEIKASNAKMSDDIQRQNIIILGMQQQFQDSLSDFSAKLQELYHHSSTATIVSPSASTSNQRQWGTGTK